MRPIILTIVFCLPFLLQAQQKLPVPELPKFKNDTVSIVSFGAVGDGITLNTKSFNDAIHEFNETGGGVLLVPPGLWLTGPFVFMSNINLHLQAGAIIVFTGDRSQYPLMDGTWEGQQQMRCQPPISANYEKNIAITGKGIIDGNGDAWRYVRKEKLTDTQWKKLVSSGGLLSEDKKTWYPSESSLKGAGIKDPGLRSPERKLAFFESVRDFLRPNLVVFNNCKNVLIEGVTFQNSPACCLHPLICEDLTVRNVSVKNPSYAENGNGIDVESCKNVLIEGSAFDVSDDAICMKSGRDAEGRKRARPTENVTVRNCNVNAAHGGFVIGTEMSGGCRNINVSNCSFTGTDIGLVFKSTRGRGGIVENIDVKNIYMNDLAGEAILFDMFNMEMDTDPLAGQKTESPGAKLLPVNETTPVFRNFNISNIYCNGALKAIYIRGLPEMHVKDIALHDMVLQTDKGLDIREASNISFRNIKVISKDTAPVIDLLQCTDLSFDNIMYKNDSYLLFRLSGDRTANIILRNMDLSRTKQKVQFDRGATESSLIIK